MLTVPVKNLFTDVVLMKLLIKTTNSDLTVHVTILIVTSVVVGIELNVNNLKVINVSLIVTILNTDVAQMESNSNGMPKEQIVTHIVIHTKLLTDVVRI